MQLVPGRTKHGCVVIAKGLLGSWCWHSWQRLLALTRRQELACWELVQQWGKAKPSNSAEGNRDAQNWSDLKVVYMIQFLNLCNTSLGLKYKIYLILRSLLSFSFEERGEEVEHAKQHFTCRLRPWRHQ